MRQAALKVIKTHQRTWKTRSRSTSVTAVNPAKSPFLQPSRENLHAPSMVLKTEPREGEDQIFKATDDGGFESSLQNTERKWTLSFEDQKVRKPTERVFRTKKNSCQEKGGRLASLEHKPLLRVVKDGQDESKG